MLKRIAIIAMVAVSLASAKTYTFTVAGRTEAGAAQLKPGEYRLKLDGPDVVLTDNEGRRIDVNLKLEEVDQKVSATSIFTSDADGMPRIVAIQFAGSKVRVVFQ